MKKILIFIVFILTSNLVEAGIFLKEKNPFIVQGAVWLYSNSAAITQTALDVPANRFMKSIHPLGNTPSAYFDGTTGVLYNRDDSCSSSTIQQPIPLPFYSVDVKSTSVPKVALIKKQGGACSIVEKIRNAETEGAIGAIVYDNRMNTNAEDRKLGVPPKSDITIPAYYVDHSVGLELYHQLEKMAGVPIHYIPVNDGTNLTTRISVRVSLMPAGNVKPVAWEYTLLVMLIILGTGIIFSVAMHTYMWKKGQRLNSVVERYRDPHSEALPMGKALLTVERLYEFPTRTIDSLPDEEERKKVETVLSGEKQKEALINTTTVSSNAFTNAKYGRSFFGKQKVLKESSLASVIIKIDAPVNNMCVVCLELFKISDEVRELPCHHEYHCICIDPWLISKSGECPLCKFDCSTDCKSETIIAGPNGLVSTSKATGFRSMLLRQYLQFKTNRRNGIGQVGGLSTAQVDHIQPFHQSTMVTNIEAPDSPGLRAALRAVEALENVVQQQQQLSPAIEEQQIAYVAATTSCGDNIESTTGTLKIDEPLISLHPHEQALTEKLPFSSADSRDTAHEEALPHPSMTTQDYAPTVATSTSTYMSTPEDTITNEAIP